MLKLRSMVTFQFLRNVFLLVVVVFMSYCLYKSSQDLQLIPILNTEVKHNENSLATEATEDISLDLQSDVNRQNHLANSSKRTTTQKPTVRQEFYDGHLVFKEYLNPTSVSMLAVPRVNCARNHTILLLVVSTGPNRERRDLVRSTWGNTTVYRNMTQQFNLQLMFIIGELELTPELKSEADQYGDLWVAQFEDNYVYLSKKEALALDWVNRTCKVMRYVDFVLKTDDDVFMNLMRILPKLWNMVLSGFQCHFVCHTRDYTHVVRSGKWSESKDLWPHDHYPMYCQGIGYFITKLGFPLVIKGVHRYHLLTNEDVFVSGVALWGTSEPVRGRTEPFIYKTLPGHFTGNPYGRHAMVTGTFGSFAKHIMSHSLLTWQWLAVHKGALKNKEAFDRDDAF